MYIDRHLEAKILEASNAYPVVMVCGQRQVGKSTMMNHIRSLAETDPDIDNNENHSFTLSAC